MTLDGFKWLKMISMIWDDFDGLDELYVSGLFQWSLMSLHNFTRFLMSMMIWEDFGYV